jgi:hypothetical protein
MEEMELGVGVREGVAHGRRRRERGACERETVLLRKAVAAVAAGQGKLQVGMMLEWRA